LLEGIFGKMVKTIFMELAMVWAILEAFIKVQ
jgi:hypothetical protein